MKPHIILSIGLMAFAAGTVFGQTFYQKNGDIKEVSNVQRAGDQISFDTTAKDAKVRLTIPVSNIDHVEFPDATIKELANIRDLIFQGNYDKALGELEVFTADQDTYKDIPGNLCLDALDLKIRALLKLDRYSDAEPLLQKVIADNSDPDLVVTAKLAQAKQMASKGDAKQALAALSDLLTQTSNPNILADAWLYKGQIYAGQKDHINAVLAYLHVPAFYTNSPDMPSALFGAAEQLDYMGEEAAAEGYLTDLVNKFPSSAEAEKGKIELRRIQNIIKSTPKS